MAAMETPARRQLGVLLALVLAYALLAFVAYAFIPFGQLLAPGQAPPPTLSSAPRWLIGLATGGGVFLIYGLMGLGGWWFARRLGLPGVFREGAGWRQWFLGPLLLGLGVGTMLVAADRLFTAAGSPLRIPHPAFPFSPIASASAAIGEEILFRSLLMGLWAFLLTLALRRWKATRAALWAGNVVAALLFSAGHLPAAMLFLGVQSPRAVPPLALGELLVLNCLVGLVAGERYLRDGLVAAVGVHLWADVVWHVIWPVLGGRT
ncbi:MAG TPA: CPBP family glutamic-type intramembrane protease [Candidatus Saccharimonadales bacterium]|nr:CPBP family glutamic-type intramembrane protease [Candidatus Saccharimonadales bacterium]